MSSQIQIMQHIKYCNDLISFWPYVNSVICLRRSACASWMLLRHRKHLSVPTQPAACSGSHWGHGSGCCPGLWQLSCLYRTLLWLLALPPEGEEETSSVSIAEAVKDSSRLPGYKPAWRVGLRLAKCEVFPVPEALIHYQGEWEPCVSHWPTGTYWILCGREILLH